MTTLSFGEAAALTYIAKRTDLTPVERAKLTKGLSKRGKRIAQVLREGRAVSTARTRKRARAES
jgi:hypothetical protein